MARVSYQRVPCVAWVKATPKRGRPILSGSIFALLEVTEQQSRAKNPYQYWWGIRLYTCLHLLAKYKKPFPLVKVKTIAT